MNKYFFRFSFSAIAAIFTIVFSGIEPGLRAEPPLDSLSQNAFCVGEKLVFDVGYGFITAGEATMSIPAIDTFAGHSCYAVMFQVNSTPTFSWFYEVRDRYQTHLDVDSIYPWHFEQHIREGHYRRDFTADFDQINHIVVTSESKFPIPPRVHDIMSAFYYARTLDFSHKKAGDRIHLHNFYKDSTYELDVEFRGRETIKVEAGTFKCLIIEPLAKEGGLFKSEGKVLLWLSDDERKIPVKVSTKVLIGSISAELREFSGINGALKARIK